MRGTMKPLPTLQIEFDRAEQARAKGNEGQARVCARRAAGIAIREYFARNGGARVATASAYDLLNTLKEDERLPAEMKTIVEHLTARVTEEFKLPVNADLIAEARKLCEWLLQSIA
jgi:HEPN domain-containing protein